MSAEKVDLLMRQLAGLLGPANVSKIENNIVVKPASASEITEVIKLARKEQLNVEPVHYMIGPAVSPGHGGSIILSLERMNKILHFNRESLLLTVEPAVFVNKIMEIAAAHGLHFPGKECQHQRLTIGENIAGCFTEGEPDFKCRVACICGIEMALPDGEIVSIDGSRIKEIGSYNLSYLLAGYRENPVIITGLHLNLLPARTGEYFLVAAFKKLDDVIEVLPTLTAYKSNIGKMIALDASIVSSSLKNLHWGAKEAGAYALFTLTGTSSGQEQTTREIAAMVQEKGAHEVLIAGATYQKEMVANAFSALLDELAAHKGILESNDLPVKKELKHQDKVYQLKALQSEPERLRAFYLA